MQGILQQIVLGIRLSFRNRMALLYGYLFPAIFLLAFRVLYRQDRIPLIQHVGELLTITILGGACFGLPTGIAAEREKGVWRRYRMLPASAAGVIAANLTARYVLLLTAGLLQLGLALISGMPLPQHPIELWIAFSISALAFIGLGLAIAAIAGSVTAAQALGQCIFLPMLIVGGVALPLSTLPVWAQHISAFLPGRYAVDAIQAAVRGTDLAISAGFDLLVLAIIGTAAVAAGTLAFRWDTQQKPSPWIGVAFIGCLIAGIAAESKGIVHAEQIPRGEQTKPIEFLPPSPPPLSAAASGRTAPKVPIVNIPAPKEFKPPATWQQVTTKDIEGVAFDRLPPETGVVAPIAAPDDEPDAETADQLDSIRSALSSWQPVQLTDPVQRVRNYLFAAAVADVYRLDPLERFVPLIVFDRLQAAMTAADLEKILYFIAVRPEEGNAEAGRRLHEINLPDAPEDLRTLRNRTMLYAFRFLGRLSRP
jgi:ABC-2 type transport system permease protein